MAGELVEVELDDEELDPPAPAARARRVRRARWSAGAWARVAAGLALVLGAGVGLDGAFAASLARVPDGLVADLRVARSARWSAPAGGLLGTVGDTVVVASTGGERVQGLALADGRPRWSLEASGCELADASGEDAQGSSIAAGDGRLVCQVMQNTRTTTVVIADASDGTVLTRFTDGPGDSWVSTAGGTAITATTLATGATNVSVHSLATGEHLWEARADAAAQSGWYVQDRTWVLLSDPPVARDLRTGAEVAAPEEASWTAPPRADGLVVRLTTSLPEAGSDTWTTVLGPDGTERWRAAGYGAAGPTLEGDVVPVQRASGGLEVRDLADGALLWETDRSLMPVALAGGVLVALDWRPEVAGSAVMTGFTARTGTELWHSAEVPDRLVTDGARFAVDVPGGVEVRDLRTGAPVTRWTFDGPEAAAADADPAGDAGATRGRLAPLPGGAVLWIGTDRVVLLGL